MEQRRPTSLIAFSRHLTSTIDVVCALLIQPCWWYRPSTIRSTFGDRAFPVALARAWNRLPSSVRNAPSMTTFRGELKTALFSVVVWQWSGGCDCTAQYNCCLPATTDCRRFCLTCLILYGAAAMSLKWQCHLNQYTVTYILTYFLRLKKFGNMLSDFGAIYECDGRTDRRQHFQSIYRAFAQFVAVKLGIVPLSRLVY